jgi:hypothetical protein
MTYNVKKCRIRIKNVYFTLHFVMLLLYRPCGKESTEVRKTQNKGKERENSYQKLKRSPEERHTQTHGNLFEIF